MSWNKYTLSLGFSEGRFSQPLHQKVIEWVTALYGSALKSLLLLQRIKANEETVSRLEATVNWVLLRKTERMNLLPSFREFSELKYLNGPCQFSGYLLNWTTLRGQLQRLQWNAKLVRFLKNWLAISLLSDRLTLALDTLRDSWIPTLYHQMLLLC